MPKKYEESEIKAGLERLRENNFNFNKTAKEIEVASQTLHVWHRKHGKEMLGEKKNFNSSLTNVLEQRAHEEKTKLYKDRIKALEELSNPSPDLVKADKTITECNAKIAKKSANVKLKAMERLEGLIEYVTVDQLLRTLEVLGKTDTEAVGDVKQRTNSFLQLVNKQVIVNKVEN